MGTLTNVATGEVVELRSHHLVGRSRSMHTALPHPEISAEHAAIRWTSEGWQVRDLGSRNGTFVDGARVATAMSVSLDAGAVLWFGSEAHAFRLTNAEPPPATAVGGGRELRGDAAFLALPDDAEPTVLLQLDPGQGWRLHDEEADEPERPIRDGERLELGGVEWTLSLPQPIVKTVDAASIETQTPRLIVRVSDDQEYVELEVEFEGTRHALPPRAHHAVVVPLARARVDAQRTQVAAPEQGWLYTDMLARELGGRRNRVYLMLHRCRKDLEQLGITEPLIEKRLPTRQMRLAWHDVEVGSL